MTYRMTPFPMIFNIIHPQPAFSNATFQTLVLELTRCQLTRNVAGSIYVTAESLIRV